MIIAILIYSQIISEEVSSRLKQSLHNKVFIELNKQEYLSQVEIPWAIDVKAPKKSKTLLLKNTKIITVFDEEDIGGKLLILGKPGSGKTIMLLKLAQELLRRAKENPKKPVPVLFSLANWKNNNQTIKNWLIERLKEKYKIGKDIGKQWVENQDIIPLLDGLDELAAERQEECIRKINNFLNSENWAKPLVVTSRTKEYQQNSEIKLKLNYSLELCPYTSQQVNEYLHSTGNEILWNSINNDSDFNNLAKTPFILNIIVLAVEEISLKKWQQFQSNDERLNYLLEAYIRRMLKPRYNQKQPPQEKTKRWLGWLAERLIEEDSTEFFIEKMQPYWLKNKFQKFIYDFIVWVVILLLCSGLISGLIYCLDIINYDGNFDPIYTPYHRLIDVLIYGLIYGLIYALYELLENQIKKIILFIAPLRNLSQIVTKRLLFMLISATVIGLIYGVYLDEIFGLYFGLLSVVISGFIFRIGDEIKTVYFLKFNLKKSYYGVIYGLIFALIIWQINQFIYGSIYPVIFGLIVWLTFWLNSGIDVVEIENKVLHNQGIRQSIINTLIISLWIALFTTPLIFIIQLINENSFQPLITSLVLGLLFGILIGILRSGTPAIKHLVLRIILWCSGYIPWNYARFLDYCTNRLFLQRVGNRYRFMHNLLRQHFARKYGESNNN